jgi:hypothetical protein
MFDRKGKINAAKHRSGCEMYSKDTASMPCILIKNMVNEIQMMLNKKSILAFESVSFSQNEQVFIYYCELLWYKVF